MSTRDEYPDLFTPQRRVPSNPRAKPFADTSRAAYESLGAHSETVEGRVLECIRRAGAYGVTRQEIAERLGMREKINVVCGRVDHLLEVHAVFEPLRGGVVMPTPDAKGRYPKGVYQQRDGRKFLVAREYLSHYPDTKRHFDQRAA